MEKLQRKNIDWLVKLIMIILWPFVGATIVIIGILALGILLLALLIIWVLIPISTIKWEDRRIKKVTFDWKEKDEV